MTYQCRAVLKNLRVLADETGAPMTFLGNTDCICLFDDYYKTYDYAKYKGEIQSIINQLISDGYLLLNTADNTFSLTQHGLHPYQFQWDAFRSFLFKSILVPAAVSFVTTLLTLLANWLFSVLLST